MRMLATGSRGIMTSPLSPPFSAASRVVNDNPPLRSFELWQTTHRDSKSGAISFSKDGSVARPERQELKITEVKMPAHVIPRVICMFPTYISCCRSGGNCEAKVVDVGSDFFRRFMLWQCSLNWKFWAGRIAASTWRVDFLEP